MIPLLSMGIRDDEELAFLRRSILNTLATDLSKDDRSTALRVWNRLNARMEKAGLHV